MKVALTFKKFFNNLHYLLRGGCLGHQKRLFLWGTLCSAGSLCSSAGLAWGAVQGPEAARGWVLVLFRFWSHTINQQCGWAVLVVDQVVYDWSYMFFLELYKYVSRISHDPTQPSASGDDLDHLRVADYTPSPLSWGSTHPPTPPQPPPQPTRPPPRLMSTGSRRFTTASLTGPLGWRRAADGLGVDEEIAQK